MILYILILFNFFYHSYFFAMSVAADFGVQVFTESIRKMAEVKMQTEGYKQEVIETHKAISSLLEKELSKIRNLRIISSIKDSLVQKIELNKNKNVLVMDSLTNVLYTSYKNLLAIIRQFINKYNEFVSKNKNKNMLLKIGILIVKSSLNEYIELLKKYNYQLQNVSQKIQTDNQFNSVYVDVLENEKFIDPLIENELEIKRLDSFLIDIDGKSDLLIRSRDLLSNNNSLLFNKISNQTLEIINKLEKSESEKDINDASQVFYDLEEQLSLFKSKLFNSFGQFEDSQLEAESYLYKNIALLDINYNKMKKIILYLNNSIENSNYSINDFIKSLYKEVLDTKNVIKKSKKGYIESLKKNNLGFDELMNSLKALLSFLAKNTQKIKYSVLSKFLNSANIDIFNYYNQIIIKNKIIVNDVIYFGYINNYLIDLKDDSIKLQKDIKNNSFNVDSEFKKFSIRPIKDVFDGEHYKKVNDVNLVLNLDKNNKKSGKSNKKIKNIDPDFGKNKKNKDNNDSGENRKEDSHKVLLKANSKKKGNKK